MYTGLSATINSSSCRLSSSKCKDVPCLLPDKCLWLSNIAFDELELMCMLVMMCACSFDLQCFVSLRARVRGTGYCGKTVRDGIYFVPFKVHVSIIYLRWGGDICLHIELHFGLTPFCTPVSSGVLTPWDEGFQVSFVICWVVFSSACVIV